VAAHFLDHDRIPGDLAERKPGEVRRSIPDGTATPGDEPTDDRGQPREVDAAQAVPARAVPARAGAAQPDAVQADAVQAGAVQADATQDGAVQDDATQDGATQDGAVQDDAAQDDATQRLPTAQDGVSPWVVSHRGPSWLRRRPFWGGLLVFLGGAEVLATVWIPLPVVVHLGMLGLAGILAPMIVILCGVLLWINPAQHIFYSIIAALLTLVSWVTSNLGGFFLGLLLGLVGAALSFAWVPPPPADAPGAPSTAS